MERFWLPNHGEKHSLLRLLYLPATLGLTKKKKKKIKI